MLYFKGSAFFFANVFLACTIGFAATSENPRNYNDKGYYAAGCLIVDFEGRPVFPKDYTRRCLFYPDGTYAMGTYESLLFFEANGQLRWKIDLFNHHQLCPSLEGRKILAMDSTHHTYLGKKLRFDRLVIIDESGKIIKEFSFYKHREELLALLPAKQRATHTHAIKNAIVTSSDKPEFSHANSFYEIDTNALSGKHPAFAKGNYVVNSFFLGLVLILDSDLKKVLWSHALSAPEGLNESRWHDVQVQKNGKLLVYNNASFNTPQGPASSIDEFDPLTKKTTILYSGTPAHNFSAEFRGGVLRDEDGSLIISDITTGAGQIHFINPAGKKIKTLEIHKKNTSKTFEPLQGVHHVNSSFLKNHTGQLL